VSCSDSANLSQLNSIDYKTKEERVEILKKEIKFFSNFEDAEFELFNVNGFSNGRIDLPGPSSWNYRFVIKVKPSDINKWTKGMVKMEFDNYDTQWMRKITEERKGVWKTETAPEFYTRKGERVFMAVYRFEGIVFKSIVNL